MLFNAPAEALFSGDGLARDERTFAEPAFPEGATKEFRRAPPLWYLKDWHFTADFPHYQASPVSGRPHLG